MTNPDSHSQNPIDSSVPASDGGRLVWLSGETTDALDGFENHDASGNRTALAFYADRLAHYLRADIERATADNEPPGRHGHDWFYSDHAGHLACDCPPGTSRYVTSFAAPAAHGTGTIGPGYLK